MKNKKILALVFVLVLVLGACAPAAQPAQPAGDPPAQNGDNGETVENGAVPVEPSGLSIGLAMAERDMWLTLLETAVEERAAELGFDFTVQDAMNDVNAQINHVQTFAVQGKDAILVVIIDGAFTDALVDAAGGIPLVFVNRTPDVNFIEQGSVHFVGSEEEQAGLFQAEFFAEFFAGQDEPDLDYVILMGQLDHAGAIGRTAGFRQGMANAGFVMNNVFEQVANFDRAMAMDMMQTFIGTGQNFDLVVANNDEMAIGAIEAMRAVGIMDIPVAGVDAGPEGVASVLAGDMAATVFQNPVAQGAGAVDVAAALVAGESPEAFYWVPFVLVTPENAHEFAN